MGIVTARWWTRLPASVRDGALAGAVAGVVSGIPSTAHALLVGRDPLEATAAAGSVLLRADTARSGLLAAALPVHFGLSVVWGMVLARFLPRRHGMLAGALAGLVIAAVDLPAARRGYPRIRALPVVPQLADHVAYGAVVGAVLARRSSGPTPPPVR